ncbi:MAG TPA: winged helix-turn-helix domain-containing protein [Terriglobales bacterium]|nr:winged helix-turn-helix domain-containing protein [Terriglobales bacterium]
MSTSSSASCPLRFDLFELDTRAGELRKQGIRLRLQGQPLQVLAVLLQRAGDLVTREELRSQIWPADTFVDFDHSLHNAIARLREVLGDSAQKPRYIETLPRRGYRFIAAVEGGHTEESENSVPAEVETLVPAATSAVKGRTALMSLALLVLASIGSAFWLVRPVSPRASAGEDLQLHSIAVLPLDNLSGDPSQEYFADGMTDELITDLAKLSSLRVISRTSVMRYKGTRKGLPEIAHELNVDAIIEGSVVRSGKRVRITAQLLHGPTDRHLWAETYERDLSDVLKLQSDVAQAIAQQVRAQVSPQQQVRFRSARSVDPDAYETYLQGRFYMTNTFSTPRALQSARSYFEQAIQKDSNFALAYSGLADSYVYAAIFRQMPAPEAYRSAKEAIRKALELDDSIGEVHDTLGLLTWRYDWDMASAEKEFNQAIALAPSYSCAHEDRALYLSMTGRRGEAMAELRKSLELDPGPSSAITEAGSYYQLRDYERLVEASQRGVMSNPDEWMEHYYLGVGYEQTGKQREAISEYQKAVELSGGDQDAMAGLAHAYVDIGKVPEARKILQDLERKSKDSYVSPYILAVVYAGLGDKKNAFLFLEKAYQERSLEISWSLQVDPRFDNLRSDARFQALLERIGLAKRD